VQTRSESSGCIRHPNFRLKTEALAHLIKQDCHAISGSIAEIISIVMPIVLLAFSF
jgi:hypothetical protein